MTIYSNKKLLNMLTNLITNLRILWLKNPVDFISSILLIFMSILFFFWVYDPNIFWFYVYKVFWLFLPNPVVESIVEPTNNIVVGSLVHGESFEAFEEFPKFTMEKAKMETEQIFREMRKGPPVLLSLEQLKQQFFGGR